MGRASPETCAVCRRRSDSVHCSLGALVGDQLRARVTHRYRAGQLLFVAGTPAQSLFVLHTGRVKVFRTARGGDEQVLRLLGPGEILGYRPVLAGETYGASAEAVEDSSVCIVPASTVRRLVREVPDLAVALLEKLAVELRLSEELMMDLIHHPVRQRAARLLLALLADNRLAARPHRLESRHVRRQDMARMIATTPETFSRVLRGFAQKGIVELARDHLDVRDETLLRRVAGSD